MNNESSRATRGVEQTKTTKIETETSQQRQSDSRCWANHWKQQRLRRRQFYIEQSDSSCLTNQSKKDWEEDKSTASTWAERLEVLSKTLTKQERLRSRRRQVYNEQSDSRCWTKQSKKDWDGDMYTTSRATRDFEQNKARRIKTVKLATVGNFTKRFSDLSIDNQHKSISTFSI